MALTYAQPHDIRSAREKANASAASPTAVYFAKNPPNHLTLVGHWMYQCFGSGKRHWGQDRYADGFGSKISAIEVRALLPDRKRRSANGGLVDHGLPQLRCAVLFRAQILTGQTHFLVSVAADDRCTVACWRISGRSTLEI